MRMENVPLVFTTNKGKTKEQLNIVMFESSFTFQSLKLQKTTNMH